MIIDIDEHKFNYLKIKIDGEHELYVFDTLQKDMSVTNKAARFNKWAKDRICPITLTGSFPAGLYADVVKNIKKISSEIEIEITTSAKKLMCPWSAKTANISTYLPEGFQLRDYQQECTEKSLQYGRGIIECPTGGGKSLIQYLIIKHLQEYNLNKILVLVPNLQLVTQIHADFIDYGFDPSAVQMFSSFDDELGDAPIVITNRSWVQKYCKEELRSLEKELKECAVLFKKLTKNIKAVPSKIAIKMFDLQKAYKIVKDENKKIIVPPKNKITGVSPTCLLDEPDKILAKMKRRIKDIPIRMKHIVETIPVFKQFDAVFVDEVHQLSTGNQVTKFVQDLPTLIRFGFTGTLQEQDTNGAEDRWNIIGTIGPVLYFQRAHELQKDDFLAQLKIHAIELVHSSPVPYSVNGDNFRQVHMLEQAYIEELEPYNNLIAGIANKVNGNSFVLFDHTKHGKELFEIVKKVCPSKQVFFINGSVAIEDRDDIKQTMVEHQDCVLVGNIKCVGTGLSIKNIRHIIFAINGKATVKIIQAIGRGIRLHEDKERMYLYDVYHNLKYSEDHFNHRRRLYEKHYKLVINDEDIKKINI
jgi:superfamily II DNA or RNA helicase